MHCASKRCLVFLILLGSSWSKNRGVGCNCHGVYPIYGLLVMGRWIAISTQYLLISSLFWKEFYWHGPFLSTPRNEYVPSFWRRACYCHSFLGLLSTTYFVACYLSLPPKDKKCCTFFWHAV